MSSIAAANWPSKRDDAGDTARSSFRSPAPCSPGGRAGRLDGVAALRTCRLWLPHVVAVQFRLLDSTSGGRTGSLKMSYERPANVDYHSIDEHTIYGWWPSHAAQLLHSDWSNRGLSSLVVLVLRTRRFGCANPTPDS